MEKKLFYDCKDIQAETGFSKAKCYNVIREINNKLKKKGINCFSGKVLASEFIKYYGIDDKAINNG